ncbi:MAG TPA: ketol-acid reductoisomerase [Chthoniobacterales bacterium]|jgi:ketol-acid reductoisomerase|nr:ketol-acid reductoisomerase [Chthoniobacterales bacterium]
MLARILTDKDVNLAPLLDKTCAVVGYGAQGRAHALNLRDSGIPVIVGLLPKSRSRVTARQDGLRLTTTAAAVRQADVVFLALPDTKMAGIYEVDIAPHLRPGQTLLFAHGFAVHYRTIVPPNEVNVVMVAPKGLGAMVRAQFVEGKGVPCVVAIQQDANGHARQLALAYAKAIGGTRAGVLETTFQEETEADLFAEQAVLCGGMSALVQAGFETLVEAGYQPEMAYFECLHELKFIVDLMHRAGISGMRERISETAKWGDISVGPKIIDESVKLRMKEALLKIRRGKFAQEWLRETATGRKRYQRLLDKGQAEPIEHVGARLRRLMPWLDEKS